MTAIPAAAWVSSFLICSAIDKAGSGRVVYTPADMA